MNTPNDTLFSEKQNLSPFWQEVTKWTDSNFSLKSFKEWAENTAYAKNKSFLAVGTKVLGLLVIGMPVSLVVGSLNLVARAAFYMVKTEAELLFLLLAKLVPAACGSVVKPLYNILFNLGFDIRRQTYLQIFVEMISLGVFTYDKEEMGFGLRKYHDFLDGPHARHPVVKEIQEIWKQICQGIESIKNENQKDQVKTNPLDEANKDEDISIELEEGIDDEFLGVYDDRIKEYKGYFTLLSYVVNRIGVECQIVKNISNTTRDYYSLNSKF